MTNTFNKGYGILCATLSSRVMQDAQIPYPFNCFFRALISVLRYIYHMTLRIYDTLYSITDSIETAVIVYFAAFMLSDLVISSFT